MLSVIATELWLSAVVETEVTVGAVVSVVEVELSSVVVLSVVVVSVVEVVAASSLLLQEKTVRLKMDIRIMYKIFFILYT
jgi:hypothetical protein